MIGEWEKGDAAFQYERKEGSVILLLWKGTGSSVRIPEEIDGFPVAKIARKAFLSNKRIQEAYLPDSIGAVGDWAFAYCSRLSRLRMPRRSIRFGKGAFLRCEKLESILLEYAGEAAFPKEEGECIGALLAAAVCKLDDPYLLDPLHAGEAQWLQRWDTKLMQSMTAADEEGYSKTILCGEEDIGSMDNNLDFFLHQKRRSKVRLALLRLLHDRGLSSDIRSFLTDYLKAHSKGCPQEETWQVVKEEYGTVKEYYDLLLSIGALTEDNFDEVICDMGTELAEMKAYLLREKERRFGGGGFFRSLSLEL